MAPIDNLLKQVPSFKENIPMWARVTTLLSFVLVFQLSGGIYLASMQQMMGATSLMHEDIMMAALASFTGISIVFPILFRLKFRFTTYGIIQGVAAGLIVCNLICMHTRSLPVMVIFSFIAGMLRMWGTFECFSTVQLRITPTRNFAVFFPVIYATVFGCISLTSLIATYFGYYLHWHYMHYFIIGLLLVVIFVTRMLLRPYHIGKPMPLFGIDWLGAAMWSLAILLIIYAANYGDYYDWFHSPYICAALAGGIGLVCLNIGRMFHIRHPYVAPTCTDFQR